MGIQLSKFLIALILIGVIATGFGVFMAGLSAEYGVSYDNATIEVYNELGELNNLTEEMDEKSESSTPKEDDVLGGFFADAYRVLIIGKQSTTTIQAMTDASLENANAGTGTFPKVLKTAIISIIIILIVIGVIVSAMVKRDM